MSERVIEAVIVFALTYAGWIGIALVAAMLVTWHYTVDPIPFHLLAFWRRVEPSKPEPIPFPKERVRRSGLVDNQRFQSNEELDRFVHQTMKGRR
jgi:hypothetical protein